MPDSLATQLVQHPQWSIPGYGWQPGMVGSEGDIAIWLSVLSGSDRERIAREMLGGVESVIAMAYDHLGEVRGVELSEADLPDIEHPATKGWLLEQCRMMARELWGPVKIWPIHVRGNWGFDWARERADYTQWEAVSMCFATADMPSEQEAIARGWLWLADALQRRAS